MQEVDKAGYETLRSKYALLTSTLHPDDLLPHFFAKKLISSGKKQEIECATREHGQNRGCEKLLDTLLSNGREEAFRTFLEILRGHPHLDYLVSQLQREWKLLINTSPIAKWDEFFFTIYRSHLDHAPPGFTMNQLLQNLRDVRYSIYQQTDFCISEEYDAHHEDLFHEQARRQQNTRGEAVPKCST